MTERFVLERVPDFQTPMSGKLDRRAIEQVADSLRVSQRNFQKLERLLVRAIQDGGLVGPGTITLAMLTAAAKTLSGDVTGTIGNTGATVVERLRGTNLPAPVAGDDGKAVTYDHGTTAFIYALFLTQTTGDARYLRIAQNLADLGSAATARGNLGLGAMAVEADDPNDGTEYVRKNNAWAAATGGGTPPTDFDLLTDGVDSLVFAGGDVTWILT